MIYVEKIKFNEKILIICPVENEPKFVKGIYLVLYLLKKARVYKDFIVIYGIIFSIWINFKCLNIQI